MIDDAKLPDDYIKRYGGDWVFTDGTRREVEVWDNTTSQDAPMLNDDRQLCRLAVRVGKHLLSSGRLVATAESCTGGWIAKALTDIAGSSAWVLEGFVTYSNEAKMRTLGVPGPLLETHGAVSEPVGTVWLAWAVRRGRRIHVDAVLKHFRGDREAVRRKTVRAALAGVLTR